MSQPPKFKRLLVKLSGEALMGDRQYGIDPSFLARVAAEIRQVIDLGCELCLVVGGGNIFRGVSGAANGLDRVTGDHMGMLATVINALAVKSALLAEGVDARVQSAIPMEAICETFVRARAQRHLAKDRVVIFAAGTGNPYFTTDTAAALRAAEMSCDAMVKATKVDGVYDSDPAKNPDAKRYETLTYDQVLEEELKVMDLTAITLAKDNGFPLVVFNLNDPGAMAGAVTGQGTFTLVTK